MEDCSQRHVEVRITAWIVIGVVILGAIGAECCVRSAQVDGHNLRPQIVQAREELDSCRAMNQKLVQFVANGK